MFVSTTPRNWRFHKLRRPLQISSWRMENTETRFINNSNGTVNKLRNFVVIGHFTSQYHSSVLHVVIDKKKRILRTRKAWNVEEVILAAENLTHHSWMWTWIGCLKLLHAIHLSFFTETLEFANYSLVCDCNCACVLSLPFRSSPSHPRSHTWGWQRTEFRIDAKVGVTLRVCVCPQRQQQ